MDLHQLEIFLWQQNLLQSEVKSMNQALKYFFTEDHASLIRKFNGYQILTGEMVNFSTLTPGIQEAKEDFDEMLCLLFGGHYKSCMLLLRSHFELINGIIRGVKTNQSQANFYNKRELKGERKFTTKSLEVPKDWENQLIALYDNLSKFTHASGKSNSHNKFVPLPQPMFIEKSFNFCLKLISEVVDHNAGLLRFCFPPRYWKQDLLKNVFGKDFARKHTDIYADRCIEYLYENIDDELIQKYLEIDQNLSRENSSKK